MLASVATGVPSVYSPDILNGKIKGMNVRVQVRGSVFGVFGVGRGLEGEEQRLKSRSQVLRLYLKSSVRDARRISIY